MYQISKLKISLLYRQEEREKNKSELQWFLFLLWNRLKKLVCDFFLYSYRVCRTFVCICVFV